MTQPSLLPALDRREKKSGRVPRSSIEAGRAVNRDARMTHVLDAIFSMVPWHPGYPMTSAEMARYMAAGAPVDTDAKLYVRRGLSDLLAAGYVEHGPARKCAISGRKCCTWVVRSR